MYGIVMPYPSRPHVVATQSSYVLFSCQHRRKADVVVSIYRKDRVNKGKWTSNLYRYTAISILEAVCHLPNHTDRLDACWQNGRRWRFNCEWRGRGPSWIIERGETHWSSGEILTHFMVLMGQFMLVLRKPANTHEFRTLVTARQIFRVVSRVVSHRLCTLHEAHPIQYHTRPSADADKDIGIRTCFA